MFPPQQQQSPMHPALAALLGGGDPNAPPGMPPGGGPDMGGPPPGLPDGFLPPSPMGPGPAMPPADPGGMGAGPQMPVGGSLPDMDDSMSDSPLLQALSSSMGGPPDTSMQGIGQGDPNMGIEQLLNMLALGGAGVGGGPMPGAPGPMMGGAPPMGPAGY